VGAGDVAGVPGGDEVDDDVPRDERNLMVTTAASIFSRSGSRGRLEGARASVTFGLHWRARFFCERIQSEGIRGAPEQRKRIGEKGEGRAHWQWSESAEDACSCADLRREIWAAWRPGSWRGGERSERRVQGTYRHGLDGHYS
jgi:hypothetical protein